MLSRVADSIYWMSRYIERAENVARFIDANYHMILDLPLSEQQQWEPLIITSGDQDRFRERFEVASRENVIQFLVFDQDNPNSICSCLRSARENARSVREHISSEMWEQVNSFYLMLRDAAPAGTAIQLPHQFFVDIMLASQLFVGLAENTMTHGEGWHFGRLGRMLERADKTSRILDVKYFILLPSVDYVGTPYDNILWGALLRSASAFEMYRKRFGRIDSRKIVEFLVLNNQFPRAIHFCLVMAETSLRNISGTPRGSYRNRADKALGRLLADFDYTSIEDILEIGLHEFLDTTQTRLNLVGDVISETFFRPALPQNRSDDQEDAKQ